MNVESLLETHLDIRARKHLNWLGMGTGSLIMYKARMKLVVASTILTNIGQLSFISRNKLLVGSYRLEPTFEFSPEMEKSPANSLFGVSRSQRRFREEARARVSRAFWLRRKAWQRP